ncbi:MAG: nuclear transport factor 2 family protein [Verrucomicrobia bacterium]|nr:nuclear transport factor 2 family protein [Prolixibacteraceae bacterium]
MTRKEIAQQFLTLCAKGESRLDFELYAAMDLKHHNPYFKGDAYTLMMAMEQEGIRNPTKIFQVQRSMEEDGLVAVHSHLRENPTDAGLAVFHILRFEENKIVEFWDIAQAVPQELINENSMF